MNVTQTAATPETELTTAVSIRSIWRVACVLDAVASHVDEQALDR